MSSDHLIDRRSPFHLRDKFSRLKTKVKDKAIRHNITIFVHENITSNDTTYSHRHGFRQHMHDMKESLKNKTHYESIKNTIKTKIDDKLDLHQNKTYPKGFYDSIFSPETENDIYLKTVIICLWVIALVCIIPTIIVIFLPGKKKTTTSANMIFFHVFLCELCYLLYVFLAIVNVARDFRLGPFLCDVANYGMYVTIPIMQFALLFLSFERLTRHFNINFACAHVFNKPYRIQAVLCLIWVVLIGLLGTFMFIKKQFNFNFIKDKVLDLAPPLLGEITSKLAARRHHCSIDGRLSSVFKTVIIVLFVILIVKPIGFSLGFNLLSPFCCKNKRKETERKGDRRTTTLVTIVLLLNLIFSFPFYFASMFNSILTRIDATRDTFALVLKMCFILRITNIIFECLAFYVFERNSWTFLSKIFYYLTCKKFPILNAKSDDDKQYTKDKEVNDLVEELLLSDDEAKEEDDDDDDDGAMNTKKKEKKKKKPSKEKNKKKAKKDEPPIASEDDNDDDEEKKITSNGKRKSEVKKSDTDDNEPEEKTTTTIRAVVKRPLEVKKIDSDDNESEPEPPTTGVVQRKPQVKTTDTDDEDDDDDDDDEEEKNKIATVDKRKSQPKRRDEVKVVEETKSTPSKSRRSMPNANEIEIRIPNGKPVSHRSSSARTSATTTAQPVRRHQSSATSTPKRRSTPPPEASDKSESDAKSTDSEASSVVNNISAASTNKRSAKTTTTTTTTHLIPKEPERRRTLSADTRPHKQHRHRTAASPSSRHTAHVSTTNHRSKRRNSIDAATNTSPQANTRGQTPNGTHTHAHTKKRKVDRRTRILEMSDEV